MKMLSKLYIVLPTVGCGILAAVGDFPNKGLVEGACYSILPLLCVYLLLLDNLSIKARIGFIIIAMVGASVAEVMVSFIFPHTPILIPMTSFDWYAYRSSYFLIGIIQLGLLVPLIAVWSSKRMPAVLTNNIAGVLMLFYGWLSTFILADRRPMLISEQMPIILAVLLIVGYINYLILKLRMKKRYAIIQGLIIFVILVLS
jgi:hypothetical protein